MTSAKCKAHVTALALPILVYSFSSCLSSLAVMQPHDKLISLPALVSLHSLATSTDQRFLKDEVPQFLPFRRCHMHLQSYLMSAKVQNIGGKKQNQVISE